MFLLALAGRASPTATEFVAPGAAATRPDLVAGLADPSPDRRFPRFHHEARPGAAPSHAPRLARAAAPVLGSTVAAPATHRLDPLDAALATRLSIPGDVATAAEAVNRTVEGGGADDAPSLPVPLPQAAEAVREAAMADGDIAALVVPLPTLRPDDAARADAEAPAPLAPLIAPPAERPVPLLAYARPDAGAPSLPEIGTGPAGPNRAAPRAERGTALYDISAATVYLPNGERLEAHSGLGTMRDDVRFVSQKMRGPTPPHTYDLTLRESLFHGVQAIRLNPVGGQRNVHNRVGLLAHTYMLGPKGDSNGCVSFKDYKRFLAAYQRGEIRRLVVVDKLDAAPAARPSLLARLLRAAG